MTLIIASLNVRGLRVDFHCRVHFTCVNELEQMLNLAQLYV